MSSECAAMQEAFPSLKLTDKCCDTNTDSLYDVYIQCSSSGSVNIIKIVNTPLNQTFPQNLYKLQSLKTLHLANTGLTGSLPEYLSVIKTLETIKLPNNQLTGIIPQSFSQLRHLYEMKLEHNRIIGYMPAKLGGTSLEVLRVNDNQISGTIPEFKNGFISVHIENNYMVGPVPHFIVQIGEVALSGNCFGQNDLVGITRANLTQRPGSECSAFQTPTSSPPITSIPVFSFATPVTTSTRDPFAFPSSLSSLLSKFPSIPTFPAGPISTPSPTDSGSSGTSPILIIAPTILGVLLVAAIGAFLFIRNKKQNDVKSTPPVQPNAYAMQPMQGAVAPFKPVDLQPQVHMGPYPPVGHQNIVPIEKSRFVAEGNLFGGGLGQQPYGVYGQAADQQQPYPGGYIPASNEKAMYAQPVVNLSTGFQPAANQNVEIPFKSNTSHVEYGENRPDVKIAFESNVRSAGSGKADYVPNVGSPSGGGGGQGSSSGSSGMVAPRRTVSSVTPGIHGWSAAQVTTALTAAGVNPDYVQMLKDREIDGRHLVQLDHERLQIMGLEPFDARVLLLMAIGLLNERNDVDRPPEYS
ncbi:hypothetical protein HDU97_010396 [Phlyctochytrium planicorne]|nr:hypothetical protein HDU97_010396 [Phlyctochytrium planicorne]